MLCGHSSGGMVVSGVAARSAHRLRAAVYLDAFLPEPGRSLLDHLPPEMRARFLEMAGAAGGAVVPPPPASAFLVGEADQAWVDALCTPQPIGTFTEAFAGPDRLGEVPRRVYVRASVYDSPAFRPFAAQAAADPGWELIEIAAGHDLEIDAPEAVAGILRAAAV